MGQDRIEGLRQRKLERVWIDGIPMERSAVVFLRAFLSAPHTTYSLEDSDTAEVGQRAWCPRTSHNAFAENLRPRALTLQLELV